MFLQGNKQQIKNEREVDTMSNVFYETINPKTSTGASYTYHSNKYHGRDIWKCYNKPSTRKVAIWEFWVAECSRLNPNDTPEQVKSNIHVVSYNCNFFTIGFEDDDNWYYITPCHNYKIPKNA